MICCEFCRSELPINAHYCGICGHKMEDRYATVTDFDNPLETAIPAPQSPPLFNSPLNPNIQGSGMDWQDTNSTFQISWPVEDIGRVNPQFTHRITDENDDVLPDLLLPGMLAMQGQLQSPAQAPIVQGSPQFGGVPSVQGTPVAPGNVPQSIPGPAHGAASATSYAPQEAQPFPVQHQQVQYPAAVTSKAGMGVVSKWIIITIVTLVIIGSSSILLAHALKPTIPPPVLTITGSNMVRDGGILHVHGQGFQPGDGVTLTIDNGLPVSLAGQYRTQAISQGSEKNAQVAGFSQMNIEGLLQPRSADKSNVTVSSTGTFDVNVSVPSDLPAGKHIIHATDNQSSLSASLQFTISSPQLVVNPTALNFGSVEVGRTVKLLVTLSNQGGASLLWTATVEGSNTKWLTLSKSSSVIGANGSSEPVIVTASIYGLSAGSHTATLRFHSNDGDVQTTVKIKVIPIAQSGQQAILSVSRQSLDFGQLQAGQQAQQNFSISNLGNLPLQWQVSSDAGNANWLSPATTNGTVQPGALPQMIQVNVDTTGLAAGSYSGTIRVTSNGGNAQVGITLVVTGSTPTPTPSPSPSPSPSPIVTPAVTSISPASGSSNGGTNVTITGTGFSSATSVSFGRTPASNFNIVSDAQIIATSPAGSGTVDVTVTSPGGTSTASSSDQFTYTSASPTWSANPTSLDASMCGQTSPCQVTLTEDANSTGNITWSASSNIGATFKPRNGILSPVGQRSVSISIVAPCQNGTFTFTGSGGVSSLIVSWTCHPIAWALPAFGSDTWQDWYGGSSYVRKVVTKQFAVQGNMFTGT
jgi:IPT/TIG domain/HYDIN/CFA65/VesB-like, Ig-like domain/Viral BACON domain